MSGKALHYKDSEMWRFSPKKQGGLWFDTVSGNYLKSLGNNCFEVMYTPYEPAPVLGHREDMVIVDDVSTEYNNSMKEVLDKYTRQLLYGTALKQPVFNFATTTSKTPAYKEKDMEIGGDYCHLCGAKLLQHNCDLVFKKRKHVRNVKRYECGTIVDKSYKSAGEGYLMEDCEQSVLIGDDCIQGL
jgi:hypothetical protein